MNIRHLIFTILLCALPVIAPAFSSPVTRASLTSTDIPTVEYCALIRNPSLYDGKEIRLRGVYLVSGKNDSKFFSSACGGSDTLWVDFEHGYQSCSPAKAVRSLARMSQKSGVRSGSPRVSFVRIEYRSAAVEFTGKFKAANPHQRTKPDKDTESIFGDVVETRETYAYVFSVSCIEKVKPLPKHAKF